MLAPLVVLGCMHRDPACRDQLGAFLASLGSSPVRLARVYVQHAFLDHTPPAQVFRRRRAALCAEVGSILLRSVQRPQMPARRQRLHRWAPIQLAAVPFSCFR